MRRCLLSFVLVALFSSYCVCADAISVGQLDKTQKSIKKDKSSISDVVLR